MIVLTIPNPFKPFPPTVLENPLTHITPLTVNEVVGLTDHVTSCPETATAVGVNAAPEVAVVIDVNGPSTNESPEFAIYPPPCVPDTELVKNADIGVI